MLLYNCSLSNLYNNMEKNQKNVDTTLRCLIEKRRGCPLSHRFLSDISKNLFWRNLHLRLICPINSR